MTTEAQPSRLLTLTEVERLTGLKSSAIYNRIKSGNFPQPVSLSSRCSRFFESEVLTWMNKLPRGVGPRPGSSAAA